MTDSLIVSQETVPDKVMNRGSQLYDGLLTHVLHGVVKETALEKAHVPRQTYSRWLQLYPEWVESIRQQVLIDAMEIRRQTNERLATARLAAQEQIDEIVLPEARAIATELVRIATKGGRDTARIAAAKELGSMVREGWAYPRLGEQPRQPDPDARLPYNPNTESVQDLNLRLPAGSEATITVKTPDPVLDLPSLPGDDDDNEVGMGRETPQS